MESPANRFIASKGEGHVGDAATDLAARTDVLDDLGGPNKVHPIVVVLLHARANSQDVGVEDHILRVEAYLLHHDLVRPLANSDLHIGDNYTS